MSIPCCAIVFIVNDNFIFRRIFYKFVSYWKLFCHIIANSNRIRTWLNVLSNLLSRGTFLNLHEHHVRGFIWLLLLLFKNSLHWNILNLFRCFIRWCGFLVVLILIVHILIVLILIVTVLIALSCAKNLGCLALRGKRRRCACLFFFLIVHFQIHAVINAFTIIFGSQILADTIISSQIHAVAIFRFI